MRPLTLDEKISIKGELLRKQVPRRLLITLDMKLALDLYYVCYGRPASTFNNPKRWHKKPVRSQHDRRRNHHCS